MELRTNRLLIRKPKKSDWKDLVNGLNDASAVRGITTLPYPYRKKDALDWIKKSFSTWRKKDKNEYLFLIELKSEKKVIGGIALHGIDKFKGTGTTGSWINKSYRRKGYITEAKVALNDFAFSSLKLRRLSSNVVKGNTASRKVQENVGYKLEGIQRKFNKSKFNGKIEDMCLYGLLKEDWKKRRLKVIEKLNRYNET